MKGIGDIFRKNRLAAKQTLEDVEMATKIKKEFIVSIEKGKWRELPPKPVVMGFVKNLAGHYGIDQPKAMALFRRDYPAKKEEVNPKPDISLGLKWGPRATFVSALALVALTVLGYLGYQFFEFRSPPDLAVISPASQLVTEERELVVEGSVGKGATVTVNGQPAEIGDDGGFETVINLSPGVNELVFIAKSRSGLETRETRTVLLKSEE